MRAFRRAITLKPNYPDAHTNLAAVRRVLGDIESALSSCQRPAALHLSATQGHLSATQGTAARNVVRKTIELSAPVVVPSDYGQMRDTQQPCSLTQGIALLDVRVERAQSTLMAQIENLRTLTKFSRGRCIGTAYTVGVASCLGHHFELGYKLTESENHGIRTFREPLCYCCSPALDQKNTTRVCDNALPEH